MTIPLGSEGLPPILLSPVLAILLSKNHQIFLSLVSNSAVSSLAMKGMMVLSGPTGGLLLVLSGREEDVVALTKPPFCRAASDYLTEQLGQRVNVIFELQKMGNREAEAFIKRELPYTYLPIHEQDVLVLELLMKGILPDRLPDHTFPSLQLVLKRASITWLVVPFLVHFLLLALQEDDVKAAKSWHEALLFLDQNMDEKVWVGPSGEGSKLRYMIRTLLAAEGYIRIDRVTKDTSGGLAEIPSIEALVEITRGLPQIAPYARNPDKTT